LDSHTRLSLAIRIHFALLRHCGEDVPVSTLIANGAEAREALWVCDASGQADLMQLAKSFRATPNLLPAMTVRGATPHDLPWGHDTSGFGITRPPLAESAPAPAARRWAIGRWLNGAGR
jgi:hypothetical protein